MVEYNKYVLNILNEKHVTAWTIYPFHMKRNLKELHPKSTQLASVRRLRKHTRHHGSFSRTVLCAHIELYFEKQKQIL